VVRCGFTVREDPVTLVRSVCHICVSTFLAALHRRASLEIPNIESHFSLPAPATTQRGSTHERVRTFPRPQDVMSSVLDFVMKEGVDERKDRGAAEGGET